MFQAQGSTDSALQVKPTSAVYTFPGGQLQSGRQEGTLETAYMA